jgi:acetyl-CoA carboxylase, biotin carboxylase subunit
MINKIQKILVANRGEIALRIMRSAKEMGIETVAVFSEADRNALHVRFADEAYLIGPAPSSSSYLVMEKIIDTAVKCKADAIHPGYGFLSENATFAAKVKAAGIIFIGPSEEAIRIMGSKLAAKEAAGKFNVPLVPGTDKPIEELEEAKRIGSKVGYPILIKASAGGGGKGMRVVEAEEELEEQMARAVSEAKSSFGDGSIFIEKFITKPRHIEIQVFGDQQGNIIHLFERDCSIQRRHQKVVEEAPSGILTPEKREAMGKAAIEVARSCGYYGAGTVEFIVDDKLDFYFLEMNTRLQVEHPVTEEITGIDLVKLQIKIAQGESLPFKQEDLKIHGHAIEVRVYAEDPANNFLPDTGKLQTYVRPQGHGVRVDDGFEEGMEIPFYYDPMIAKLVVHAETRELAIDKMIRAIDEYQITGIETTLGFCRFVMEHEAFRTANFNTKFVEQYFNPSLLKRALSDDELNLAAVFTANYLSENKSVKQQTSNQIQKSESRKWKKNRLS